jgi:hypothetical protein
MRQEANSTVAAVDRTACQTGTIAQCVDQTDLLFAVRRSRHEDDQRKRPSRAVDARALEEEGPLELGHAEDSGLTTPGDQSEQEAAGLSQLALLHLGLEIAAARHSKICRTVDSRVRVQLGG